MRSIIISLIIILFFSINVISQEQKFPSVISAKVIAFSPIGLAVQINPIKPVGLQIGYQHSIWSESWRATADLKIYPWWLIERFSMVNFYFAPYFRYKDVELFSINMTGKDCTGFCGDYLQSYYTGLIAGSEVYLKFATIDIHAGAGISTDKYAYKYGFQFLDLRAGFYIGFYGKTK